MLPISQIYELANSVEIPLIVEGIKDKEVLKRLGFKNIFDISGKPLEKVVSKVKFKEVAILTDFDEEGEKKAKILTKLFNSHGIKVNSFIREKIRALQINKIEELNFFTKFLEGNYGKNCSIYDKIFNRSRIFMRRLSGKTRCNRGDFWSDRRFVRS